MTRINCVPPSELTDKHLIAEYRELPRIFRLARFCPEAPAAYTMGKGHLMFFYNKLSYCLHRQRLIVAEMKLRGFNPKYNPMDLWQHHEYAGGPIKASLWNSWEPSEKDMLVNRVRIAARLRGAA